MDFDRVDKILKAYGMKETHLVSILLDIQTEANFLPREILSYVAKKLGIPLSQVCRFATFYKAFSLKPRGRHVIKTCLGTACHVRGAVKVLQTIERELGIRDGDTTRDFKFTLETVNCLGACALGPLVVIDNDYYGQMNTTKVPKMLKDY
ncbi:MAG: NAD(P)H-dependent oxidoreductase subunit E [Candidatus Aminicenantes bacterium]|nr:NAD(P)H-dependent oxidoreductase subunit E [Candidatus Aminicenantes bacterium]